MKKGQHLTNQVPWTAEEDKKLLDLAAEIKRQNGGRGRYLVHGGPAVLASHFPERSESSVYSRWKLLKGRGKDWQKGRYHKAWTAADIEKLKSVYSVGRFHLDLKDAFPDRRVGTVVAKAIRLGLSRPRLHLVPFRLSLEDAALAAGMINADGSIGWYESKRENRKSQRTMYAAFYNTEKVMVDWFDERIPRGSVRDEDLAKEMKKYGISSRKHCYRWTLRDKPTLCLFLEQIYPYLLGVKKERARLILEHLVPIIAKDVAESYAA